jgi:alpha-tubulin suppressor-like RCC1 family protein
VTFFIAKSPTFPFDQIPQGNKQKQITSIVCGSGHTLAVSASNHLYFWGKMANSPRGEAMVYPKMQQELYDWPVQSCAAGSNCVFVGSRSTTSIFWGLCVAGKYGLENDGKNSTNPQIVSSLGKLDVIDISCGYAHSCFVVVNGPVEKESQSKLDALPRLPAPFDESKDGKGKKRAAPAKKATASKKR